MLFELLSDYFQLIKLVQCDRIIQELNLFAKDTKIKIEKIEVVC